MEITYNIPSKSPMEITWKSPWKSDQNDLHRTHTRGDLHGRSHRAGWNLGGFGNDFGTMETMETAWENGDFPLRENGENDDFTGENGDFIKEHGDSLVS